MKKLLLVIIILAVVAGTGMPYISGIVMEKMVYESAENVNQMYAESGSDLKFEIDKYERGFSRSVIEWKLDLGVFGSLYGIDELRFVETAKHGYTKVISETRLDNNPWFNVFINKHLDGRNPLHIQTVYPLNGDIVSSLVLDTFTVDDGDLRLYVKPAKMSFSMDKAFQKFSTEMNWEGCEVLDQLKVENIEVKSGMTRVSSNLWEGETAFALDRLEALDKQVHTQLDQLKFQSKIDFNQEENKLSMSTQMGADKIIQQELEILEKGFVRLALNNLDAPGYEKIIIMYTNMVKDMMTHMGKAGIDPSGMDEMMQQQMTAIGFQVMTEAEKLLKQGLEIEITDLKAKLPQGEIKGHLSLGLKKDMTFAAFTPIMMKPSLILDIFSLDSNLSLPTAVAGNARNLLQPVYPGMQTGLFVESGENLTHQAQIKDGKLFINQKEVILN